MNADGSEPVRLTDHPGQDAAPEWSANGQQIVFHRDVNDGIGTVQLQLFIMNADGSGLAQITGPPISDSQTSSSFPAWGRGHDVPSPNATQSLSKLSSREWLSADTTPAR